MLVRSIADFLVLPLAFELFRALGIKVCQLPQHPKSGTTEACLAGSPSKSWNITHTVYSSLSLLMGQLWVGCLLWSEWTVPAWEKGCNRWNEMSFLPLSVWLFLALSFPGYYDFLAGVWRPHKGFLDHILRLSWCLWGKLDLGLPILPSADPLWGAIFGVSCATMFTYKDASHVGLGPSPSQYDLTSTWLHL